MKRFSWRYVLCLALAVYVLVDVCVCGGPLCRWVQDHSSVAARVAGAVITRLELEEAMRDHLWRRGEEWLALSPEEQKTTREVVIERLVDDRLIRLSRMKTAVALRADDELEMFARQFDRDGDYERRLRLRQIEESELKAGMQGAIDDQAWIETKIAGRVEAVTEKEVSEWLREHATTLLIPPVHDVAHIYLTTHDVQKLDREAEIREIHRKLKMGVATFKQLALQYSDDERSKQRGGALGWCARDRMPGDFMDAVEKLSPGEISEPVETKLGWHVMRLINRKPGRAPAADEVRSEVMALLRDQRRDVAVSDLITELRAQSHESILMNQAVIHASEPPHETLQLEDRAPRAK